MVMKSVSIIHCSVGLSITPGASQVVASFWADDCSFDTCSSRGAQIVPANGTTGSVVRTRFSNCWTSSATGIGFLVNGDGASAVVQGLEIVNHHAFLNGSDGLQVIAATDVNIMGGEFAQNARDGIRMGNSSGSPTGFGIIGVRSGNSGGLSGNTGWGINVTFNTGSNYRIMDCDLRGNTAGALFDAGVSPKIVLNNLPWDTSCPSQYKNQNNYVC